MKLWRRSSVEELLLNFIKSSPELLTITLDESNFNNIWFFVLQLLFHIHLNIAGKFFGYLFVFYFYFTSSILFCLQVGKSTYLSNSSQLQRYLRNYYLFSLLSIVPDILYLVLNHLRLKYENKKSGCFLSFPVLNT